MGACCGKGGSDVKLGAGFEKAEVQFVWPKKKDVPHKVAYRPATLKALVKKYDELKYDGPKNTRVTLPKGEYNSVWWVGNVKYVVPGSVAPTLLRKLLESDAIKSKVDMLGLKEVYEKLLERFKAGDDPQISELPDGKFKDALTLLEGALPVNKWAIEPDVTVARGKYVGDVLEMTTTEKLADQAAKKLAEPETQIALARAKKKIAVEGMKMAFQQLGIDLDAILGSIFEIFGVDPPKLDLDAKIDDMKCDILEPLSEEEQKLMETGTPEFQKTAIARFCLATENTKVPVKFSWGGPAEKLAVRVWKWSEAVKASEPHVHDLAPSKDKEGNVIPEKFEATVQLSPGRWAFQWEIDGVTYFSHGNPVPADKKDTSYKVLEVKAIKPIFV